MIASTTNVVLPRTVRGGAEKEGDDKVVVSGGKMSRRIHGLFLRCRRFFLFGFECVGVVKKEGKKKKEWMLKQLNHAHYSIPTSKLIHDGIAT